MLRAGALPRPGLAVAQRPPARFSSAADMDCMGERWGKRGER
jgi:hypothetical protein